MQQGFWCHHFIQKSSLVFCFMQQFRKSRNIFRQKSPYFIIHRTAKNSINIYKWKSLEYIKPWEKTTVKKMEKEDTCLHGPSDWDHDSKREREKKGKSFGEFWESCAYWAYDLWHSAEGLVLTTLPSLPVFICPDARSSHQTELIWAQFT